MIQQILGDMKTNTGESLEALNQKQAILLVFLRYFGCVFCKEAMRDLSLQRARIESKGLKIVLVHMSSTEMAEEYFSKYKLQGISHVSDPECRFYSAFGLMKGTFSQLFGLKVFLRGASAGLPEFRYNKEILGDGFQMPGVFIIQNNTVVDSYVHASAADRPDYDKLTNCTILPPGQQALHA